MAFALDDFYLILSDGMYAGSVAETTITAVKRYTRILSHGLLEVAPEAATGIINTINIGKRFLMFLSNQIKV